MAGSKPTAVHYLLIFFVATTIICAVGIYVVFQDLETARQTATKAQEEARRSELAYDKARDDVTALKNLTGYGSTDWDITSDDAANQNVIQTAALRDIATFRIDSSSNDYLSALRNQRAEIESLRKQVDDETDLKKEAVTKAANTEESLSGAVTIAEEKRQQAQQEKIRDVAEQETRVQQLISELDDTKRTFVNYQTQVDEERAAFRKEKKVLVSDLQRQKRINEVLKEKWEASQDWSYDRPDGMIKSIDHNSGIVTIDLGRSDKLPERLSFSVYKKSNDGVGKSSSRGDIKATIEVLEVIGPNLAEARIKTEDINDPILPKDPIYTPLWTPGRAYEFTLVGLIDVNNDGVSDRGLLRERIRSSGGEIDVEILDDGSIPDDKVDPDGNVRLSSANKFVIIGELMNPEDFAPGSSERLAAEKMIDSYAKLKDAAQLQSVREISLRDFLDYMGFTAPQRVIRPGEEQGPSGRRPTYTSTGNNSGVYGTKLRAP